MLYNAAKRARNSALTANQNQGGGSKKAGLPYQVGRGYLTSIVFHSTGNNCCNLKKTMTMSLNKVSPSRNISTVNVPGLGRYY